jgi:hypothetical protein
MTGKGVIPLVMGVFLGAGATWVAREFIGHEPQTSPATAAGESAGLSRQLADLETDVRALKDLVERNRLLPPAAAHNAVEPMPGASPDAVIAQLDALRAAVAALSDRIDAQSSESHAALTALQADMAHRAPAIEPMPETMTDKPVDAQRFDPLRGRSADDLSQEYLLWSYEQVSETFGRPSGVRPGGPGGGIKFLYDTPDGETFIFWFVSGKVVLAEWA